LTSILTESLALQKEQAYQEKEWQVDVYGHQEFFMSFVPALNSMPLHVAMEARLKIAEVVNASLQRSCTNLSTSTGHHSTSAGWSTSGCSTPAPSKLFITDSNSDDFNIIDYILLQNAVQNNWFFLFMMYNKLHKHKINKNKKLLYFLFIYFGSMDLNSQDMMKSQTRIFGYMLLFLLMLHDWIFYLMDLVIRNLLTYLLHGAESFLRS
jgi:hypothetical protein